MVAGDYPKEYNPRIHGPYNPGKFYGKIDTALSEVKLGEFGSWMSRRNWGPKGIFDAVVRAQWRWSQKYLIVKRGGVAPVAQFCVGMSLLYYFLQYRAHTNHRHAKYH